MEGTEPVRPEAADGKSLPMETMGSARADRDGLSACWVGRNCWKSEYWQMVQIGAGGNHLEEMGLGCLCPGRWQERRGEAESVYILPGPSLYLNNWYLCTSDN